jgi:SAM-dependent methyltransferase
MSLGLKPEQFDAIIINHVIEHVFDVVALSAECFRLLKVGGRVVIVTPNGESLGHQKFQKDWRGLEPPRHIHIFSANSLNTLLLKAGFAHIDVSSKAASPRGVFEASYQLRDIGRSYVEKYPKTAIYYKSLFYQYREWYLCRKLQSVGEELLATAIK